MGWGGESRRLWEEGWYAKRELDFSWFNIENVRTDRNLGPVDSSKINEILSSQRFID